MKKLLRVIILNFLFFLITGSVLAEGKTYHLDELGMSVDFPTNYVVITQDENQVDSRVELYGLTKDGILSYMSSNGLYLDAWDEKVDHEIVITMSECALENLNQIKGAALNLLISSLAESYETVGAECIKANACHINNNTYIKIYIKRNDDSKDAYSLQYMTISYGKSICITMHSSSGEIDSSQETVMKKIVESVHFDMEQQSLEAVANTPSFVYTDTETGLSFTVPENWEEIPMSEERNIIDAKFGYSAEGLVIIYASGDIWAQLPEEEKKYYSRDDINNSIVTKADVAEMNECKESEVLKVTVGEMEYYKASTNKITEILGIDMELNQTAYVRCENGYLYTFQFIGNCDNEHYNDFEELVASVVYPKSSVNVISEDFENTTTSKLSDNSKIDSKVNNKEDLKSDFIAYILVNLVITIAVYTFPIIAYRYAVHREPIGSSKAKLITVCYGIFALIVMHIIKALLNGSTVIGGALFLWSGVNYRILTSGKRQVSNSFEEKELISAPDLSTKADLPSLAKNEDDDVLKNDVDINSRIAKNNDGKCGYCTIRYCHKCGNKLIVGSEYCNKCGTKIPNMKGE